MSDEQFLEIREKLKQLPVVKASDDFVNNLQRRINLEEAEHSGSALHKQNVEKNEEGFIAKLFGGRNPWLVPALGFTVVVFLIFTWVFMFSKNGSDKNTVTNNNNNTPSENTAGLKKDSVSAKTENKTYETIPGKELAQDFGNQRNDLPPTSSDREAITNKDNIKTVEPVVPEVRSNEEQLKQDFVKPIVPSTSDDNTGKQRASIQPENERTVDEKKIESKELLKSAMPRKETLTESKDSNKEQKSGVIKSGRSVKDANDIDKSDLEGLREKVQDKK